jgi:hypothetical protein
MPAVAASQREGPELLPVRVVIEPDRSSTSRMLAARRWASAVVVIHAESGVRLLDPVSRRGTASRSDPTSLIVADPRSPVAPASIAPALKLGAPPSALHPSAAPATKRKRCRRT